MTKNTDMGNKISKTLDAVFARVTFDLTKADIRQSYKDRIALEILREDGTMAYRALVSKLKDWELFQAPLRIENLIKTQPRDEEVAPEEFLKQYRRKLLDENKTVRNVSTAHALLDITADTTTATSQILAQYGITAQTIASAMTELTDPLPDLQSEIRFHAVDLNDESSGKSSAMLDKFGSDLTRLAREGKIDPVIGREAEIDRVIQILSRRKKNNPILIGEAGVGKSAIIEGLALRIASGEVPYTIRNKTIFSLDVASLVAGTKFRGEFEERMQQLLDELRRSKDTIIFIDEIHTIVGAGATQGSLDTANILKPALARGELQTIGATTLDEFRENIESDSALERRFQKVMVDEPDELSAISILRGLKERYENHHKVRIKDEAIIAAVQLSVRYITDRFLPDKAIDLVDEAASRARLNSYNSPQELNDLDEKLKRLTFEKNKAIKSDNFDRAKELTNEINATQEKIKAIHDEWKGGQSAPAIGADDIAQVVSGWTGVPVVKLTEQESEKLLHLEENLHKRIIGQDEAVSAVARAIRRARAGLNESGKPIGSFIFVGPTGVGKTDLAKALAENMFGDEKLLIRMDMSEYMEKHSVSKLIGAPPGYVGYDDNAGGQLTERVRRKPYSVVLFDEVEKAHPDVFNMLLQILDDGRLTDSKGRVINFKNTIIILTSNVGASQIKKMSSFGFTSGEDDGYDDMKEKINDALKEQFRPEFLNRLDDVIIFRKLTKEEAGRICYKIIDGLRARLKQKGISLEIAPEAMDKLIEEGYSEVYGARPMKRTVQRRIEDRLSDEILAGNVLPGEVVTVDLKDSEFAFRSERRTA